MESLIGGLPDSGRRNRASWLEVLDQAGHVVQRLTLTHLPLTIGRSYENDVIVDDPYVSPVHLRLWRCRRPADPLRDAGRVSGLYRERERVTQVELRSGTELRIGHTRLRYRDKDLSASAAGGLLRAQPLVIAGKAADIGVVVRVDAGLAGVEQLPEQLRAD
ncbi:MAG: FHA domain-containing protein [Candidatus Competibacteraceae bacterium]